MPDRGDHDGSIEVITMGRCRQYHCVDARFDAVRYVEAYGAQGSRVHTIGEYVAAVRGYLDEPRGVFLIDVPVAQDADSGDASVDVLSMFNTYIQAHAGIDVARRRWETIIGSPRGSLTTKGSR